MTPPRWLREQRRAQATTTRNLTHLPLAVDEVSHSVVRLRLHLAQLMEAAQGLGGRGAS